MKSVAKANALIVEGRLSSCRVILRVRRIIEEIVTHFARKKSNIAILPGICRINADSLIYCDPIIFVAKFGASLAQQEGE
jgi:hypothetical protein